MFDSLRRCYLLRNEYGCFIRVPGLLRTEYLVLVAAADLENVESSVFVNTLETFETGDIRIKNTMAPKDESWAAESGLVLLMFTVWNSQCELVEAAVAQYCYRAMFKIKEYKYWCEKILSQSFERVQDGDYR